MFLEETYLYEIIDYLTDEFYKYTKKNITSDDFKHLYEYTCSTSKLVADYLLSDGKIDFYNIKIIEKTIEIIDRQMKLNKLGRNLTVYHGTTDALLYNNNITKYNKNNFITKAYLSTSLSYNSAYDFIDYGTNKVMLELELNPNCEYLFLKPLSQYSDENEILINRNITFDVIDYQNRSLGGITKVKLKQK